MAITLPLERPLHDARPDTRVETLLEPVTDEDIGIDEDGETVIHFDEDGQPRRARLPQVTVRRT